jgi:transposase
MENTLKQSVGIDCAKDDFVACFGILNQSYDTNIRNSSIFKNNTVGFKKLMKWVNNQIKSEVPLVYVVEATGVYHEKLACYITDQGEKISVVLPQRAKNFSKTLKTKTVTDKEASKSLTVMGLEKKLDVWRKPDKIFNKIKQLTREREQVQKQLTQVKNQIHAEKAGAWPNEKSLKRLNQHKNLLERQLIDIGFDVKEMIEANPELNKKVDYLTSIPGVGLITAATVIGETDGFCQIRNKKQLVSFAGYDVIDHTSGTTVRGKPHISHKGNRHIRKALHMPALTGIRWNDEQKTLYNRLLAKHGIKMKGVVAIQRKQLVLIYILWKKEEMFDKEKHLTNDIKKIEQPLKTALIELAQSRPLVL